MNVQIEEIFEESIRDLIVTFRCLLDGMTRLTTSLSGGCRCSEREFNREIPNKIPKRYHYTNPLGCTENKISYPEDVGSAVGKDTPYGLVGPGIESQWGRDFPHSSRSALGPTQPPVQ